jgi:prevent-host-death family protein
MATQLNIHDAKTHLSQLIERACAGEEVVIAKAGKPMVRLAPVEQTPTGAVSARCGARPGLTTPSSSHSPRMS